MTPPKRSCAAPAKRLSPNLSPASRPARQSEDACKEKWADEKWAVPTAVFVGYPSTPRTTPRTRPSGTGGSSFRQSPRAQSESSSEVCMDVGSGRREYSHALGEEQVEERHDLAREHGVLVCPCRGAWRSRSLHWAVALRIKQATSHELIQCAALHYEAMLGL